MNVKLKKDSKKRLLTAFLIVIAVIGVYTIFGEKGLIDLYGVRGEYNQVLDDNTRITTENAKLTAEVALLKNDPSYVEHVARQELGMVRVDEYIYKFE